MAFDLTADKIAVFSAIVAVLSLLVALISACVAAQSATAARLSAETAARTLRRSIVRDLLGSCQETINDERAIHSLADRLISERNDSSMFNGTFGGDRPKLYLKQDEECRKRAVALAGEPKQISLDSTSLYDTSDVDLDKRFFELEKTRGEIRVIRNKLELDLEDISAQNHQHRDKTSANKEGA